ncbi:MAG: choice-of-anchor J domain-containing protein, partial [Gaiellaceae bacterium]
AQVWVSVEGGHNWSALGPVANGVSTWNRVQLDLTNYAGLQNVALRFTVTGENGRDGWYIDDVRVDEACPDVFLNPPPALTEHSVDLSWSASTCADFQRYDIYRSPNPDLSGSTLLTSVTDPSQTTYSDTNLKRTNATYYYRVYVVDAQGLVSSGSNPIGAKTLDGVTPIALGGSDDMESGDTWGNDLPWGLITDASCHSGTHCWHESPGGPYANNEDASLTTRLNLSAGGRPLLTFWHRYNLENYADFGFVEVSTDAVTWTRLFSITGFGGITWRQERIDLSQYAFQTLWVRFRLVTDAANTYDGWYIDDVSVQNNTAVAGYPFFDNMESAASDGNWIGSTWRRIASDGVSGTHSWT